MLTSLLSASVDDERSQPQQHQIKTAILLFPSRVVLYRRFRQVAPREVRNITSAEFKAVAQELAPTYGDLVVTRLRRQLKESMIFVKRCTNAFQPFSEEFCSLQQYAAKFDCPLHPTVTENLKNTLTRNGHVPAGFF